ncbi:MAG: Kelch repeat-containing protein [Nitrospiria bacterium]
MENTKDLPVFPGTWQTPSPMKKARSHPGVAVSEGKIYAFGGGGPNFKSLNSSEIYDPATNQWLSVKPMPTARSGTMATRMGEMIVVMGGGFKKPDGKFKFLKTVEAYFPKEDRWEAMPDLLQPHDYPASTVVDGQVYIIGGHHPDATEGGPQTDPAFAYAQRWDGKSDRWEEIPEMPTPRFASSAVAVDGHVWVMGGVAFTQEGFHEYDRIEVYDPKENAWHRSGLRLPYSSAGQGACVFENRLYSFGGFQEKVGIGKHGAVYDRDENKWYALPPMPFDRAAMGIVVLGDTIYLVGGWRADRSVKDSVVSFKRS